MTQSRIESFGLISVEIEPLRRTGRVRITLHRQEGGQNTSTFPVTMTPDEARDLADRLREIADKVGV
jgi:hypothetical protein